MQRDVPKITLTERRFLELNCNLADAQNYVGMTKSQSTIVDQFGSIFHKASRDGYSVIKTRFESALLSHLSQHAALTDDNKRLLCYSATNALEVAANFVRTVRGTERQVGLLHPTFDALLYMAVRHGFKVTPVPEQALLVPDMFLKAADIGTLILTLPNNPTGFCLEKDDFAKLVSMCRQNDILLIIDCCYRYYASLPFDYYAVLLENGVDYILVEDTGKTFPLLDIKVGVLNCSRSLYAEIERIHSDFLLEVSKFSMAVISEFFVHHSHEEKACYLQTVEKNRHQLRETAKRIGVSLIGGANINVQLLKLPESIDSTKLQEALAQRGVGVVDAKRLFWNESEGCRHIRVALSREPEYFARGLVEIESVVKTELSYC